MENVVKFKESTVCQVHEDDASNDDSRLRGRRLSHTKEHKKEREQQRGFNRQGSYKELMHKLDNR